MPLSQESRQVVLYLEQMVEPRNGDRLADTQPNTGHAYCTLLVIRSISAMTSSTFRTAVCF